MDEPSHLEQVLQRIKDAAAETANLLKITFEPIDQIWTVNLGPYRAQSLALDTACNAVLAQRREMTRR